MKALPIYLILILSSFNNNSGSGGKVITQKETTLDHDTSVYIIETYDPKRNFHGDKYSSATLTKSDISAIQSLLEKSVIDYNSGGIGEIDLKKYKRQYLPVTNKKNEKEVWIYCACDGYFGLVRDGGKCYFRLKLNLTRKTYTEIITNSSA